MQEWHPHFTEVDPAAPTGTVDAFHEPFNK